MEQQSEVKERTAIDIRKEWIQTVAKAGETQYNIARAQKDLELYNKQLLDLNIEFVAVNAAEAKKQAAAVAVVPVENKEGEQTNV